MRYILTVTINNFDNLNELANSYVKTKIEFNEDPRMIAAKDSELSKAEISTVRKLVKDAGIGKSYKTAQKGFKNEVQNLSLLGHSSSLIIANISNDHKSVAKKVNKWLNNS